MQPDCQYCNIERKEKHRYDLEHFLHARVVSTSLTVRWLEDTL